MVLRGGGRGIRTAVAASPPVAEIRIASERVGSTAWLRERGMGATVVAGVSTAFGVLLLQQPSRSALVSPTTPTSAAATTVTLVVGILSVLLVGVAVYVAAIVTVEHVRKRSWPVGTRRIALHAPGSETSARSQRGRDRSTRTDRRGDRRRDRSIGARGSHVAIFWVGVRCGFGILLVVCYEVVQPDPRDSRDRRRARDVGRRLGQAQRRVLPRHPVGGDLQNPRSARGGRLAAGRHSGAIVLLCHRWRVPPRWASSSAWASPVGVFGSPSSAASVSFTGLVDRRGADHAATAGPSRPAVRPLGDGAWAAEQRACGTPSRSSSAWRSVVMGVTLRGHVRGFGELCLVKAVIGLAWLWRRRDGRRIIVFPPDRDRFAGFRRSPPSSRASTGQLSPGSAASPRARAAARAQPDVAGASGWYLEAVHVTITALAFGALCWASSTAGSRLAQSLLGSVSVPPAWSSPTFVAPAIPWLSVTVVIVATAVLTLVAAVVPTALHPGDRGGPGRVSARRAAGPAPACARRPAASSTSGRKPVGSGRSSCSAAPDGGVGPAWRGLRRGCQGCQQRQPRVGPPGRGPYSSTSGRKPVGSGRNTRSGRPRWRS